MEEALREKIAQEIEAEVGPLLELDRAHEGGYNCCGCETYQAILDHAVRVVRGHYVPGATS